NCGDRTVNLSRLLRGWLPPASSFSQHCFCFVKQIFLNAVSHCLLLFHEFIDRRSQLNDLIVCAEHFCAFVIPLCLGRVHVEHGAAELIVRQTTLIELLPLLRLQSI